MPKPRRTSAPATPAASAPKKRTAAKGPTPFTTDNASAALAHFTPLALARYAAGDVPHYNADLDVIPSNINRAMEAVAPLLDAPAIDRALRARVLEIPALQLALIVADARVVEEGSSGNIKKLQDTQRPLRMSLLSFLDAVSLPGACELVPVERVAAIRAGKGPIDEARDGINGVALVREYEAVLRNKHPYTAAQFATLEGTSIALLRLLSPTEAAKIVGETSVSEETKVRDGLWALLDDRYEELLVLAAGKWGVRRLYDHVPALSGRTRTGAKEKTPDPSGGGGGGSNGGTGGEKPAKDSPAAEEKKPAK